MNITNTTLTQEVLNAAETAQENAYAPHSNFYDGAAILTKTDEIYTGANIENINYTNTEHAEELALHKAVHDGHREFKGLALTLSGEPVPPCGSCRQTLSEFCDANFEIVIKDYGITTLGELLPNAMEDITNEKQQVTNKDTGV